MKKVVLKILKLGSLPLDCVMLKPFLDLDSNYYVKLVAFLQSETPGKVEEIDGATFFHSPVNEMKGYTRQAKWIASICKSNQVDIIHCDQHTSTVIGVKAKRMAKVGRLFSHVHGNNMCRSLSRKIFYWKNKKHIEQLVACSDFIKQNVLDTFPGYSSDQVMSIANGVDISKFNPDLFTASEVDGLRRELGISESNLLFLSICRLSPDKNLTLLLNAFAKCYQKNQSIRLLIAGDGRLKAQLSEQIDQLGLAGKIVLLGFRSDVKELLAAADVMIQPSRREGFSVSVLEAAAMAKPIIFSRTGGAEILEGICDQFLVTPNVEEEISVAIEGILTLDKEELSRIGRSLREKVKSGYTHEVMTARLDRLYQSK